MAKHSKPNEWSKWYLVPENQRGKRVQIIKRYKRVDGKTTWQRYPREGYAHLRAEDLESFLVRINGERELAHQRAAEAYKIKHQFITQDILDEWDTYIRGATTSEELANAVIRKSRTFLHFFINQMELPDPIDWLEKQQMWGNALLGKPSKKALTIFEDGEKRSKRTIEDHIHAANRFMRWLHKKNPRLFPLLKFEPIEPAVLRDHDARRRMGMETSGIGKYVKPKDWETICRKMSPQILPYVKLAYFLGLRRAETLGAQLDDVRKGHFFLERQLESYTNGEPAYGPPKNRKPREVMYWFTTPEDVYELIENLPPRMHPDTLTDRLSEEMARLGLDYEMHDFRRTWITRALREKQAPIDVQRGAGHQDLKTTMRYVMEDREMDSERFVPKAKKAG